MRPQHGAWRKRGDCHEAERIEEEEMSAIAAPLPGNGPARAALAHGGWKTLRTMALPAAAISVLFVMVVPVPAFVMDMLLACSMAASILVFLSAVQLRRAVDFSVFPTLLLLLTLFRLSLNIASSRRSLCQARRGRRVLCGD